MISYKNIEKYKVKVFIKRNEIESRINEFYSISLFFLSTFNILIFENRKISNLCHSHFIPFYLIYIYIYAFVYRASYSDLKQLTQ